MQRRPVTISDALLLRVGLSRRLLVDLALILAFSWVTALCARLSFQFDFTPIPISGQTFAVLLAGALLGSKRGALSMMAYLAQGAAGLPVFAWMSQFGGYGGGVARLVGPSAGYMYGFVVAAFVVGLLAERGWDRRFWTLVPALALGNVIIYAFGLPWLAQFMPWANALKWGGLYPFIPGDLVKLLLAALVVPSGWALLRRWRA